MNKSLFALAALVATGTFAQTTDGKPGFQITGGFNAGEVFNDYKGNKVDGLEQNGLGTTLISFRGLRDLGGGLSAYINHTTDLQIMSNRGDTGVPATVGTTATGAAVKTNNGTAATFGNDQKMVGMRGKFGDIAFGTINNSGYWNYVALVAPVASTSYGGGYNIINAAEPTMSGVRWDNTFQYKTPNIGGFVGTLQYVAKQTPFSATATAAAPINYGPTLGDYNMDGVVELSVLYSNGPLKVGLTTTRTDGVSGAIGSINTLNALGARYEINPNWTVTAGVENVTVGGLGDVGANRQDRRSYIAGVYYKTGANTFWGQYGSLTENAANKFNGKNTNMATVGYKYAIDEMTSIEARFERADDQAGVIALPGSLVAALGNTIRTRSVIGIKYSF